MHERYRLYGAEISYFTGKVRAYLRWKGLPFDEILADAGVYREIIVPRVGFPVIPVVVTPADETLQDSTEIIDELERRHGEPSVEPSTPIQRLVCSLLELYGDEWLVIPAMHYRWHHNRRWALKSFGELSAPDATPEEQAAIGAKRAEPFANAAVLLGAEPHMHAAVESSYEALLGELDRHFAKHAYLLGDRPSLGDFGLIGPLYAHQYRDPESGKLMRRLAPHVVRWVEGMQHPLAPRNGAFLPGDEIPATLVPVLSRMMREQLPVLVDSSRLFREWLGAHPGERVPRAIGVHEFELEGRRGKRIVRPYSLWMLQRARDVYAALSGAERAAADRLLRAAGGEAFLTFEDGLRLSRDGMSVKPTDS
ncbi:MAG TPA: glutathione S-transferase family protein [Polyangiaceae bacterium]|nr:glutathione S-transferase family protein [Polyangiaceae bacterium]